jgi:hypothetical protein
MKQIKNMGSSAIVVMCLVLISPCLAAEYKCPESIKTEQKLVGSAPLDWANDIDHQRIHLQDGIMVFDGQPSELASLVPEVQKNKTYWTFNKAKDRPIYLTCDYIGTAVRIIRPLPKEFTKCVAIESKTKPVRMIGLSCQ